ncbi:hypothetical protein C8F04DRAFT_101597 [Mycena alexandri]|uniref:F-box domain-containing protein n=1 Tax=Mycena alexandri TaxID=1745969 RepID=A0AAD6SH72_9AGAR|nr:hypothetical protein C8F04DRAFT_101597 [Mycena alexandri]
MKPKGVAYAYDAKLPTEIWIRCSTQCRHEDLCSLTLVSRYFRDVFQPLLYEHQYIVISNPDHQTGWTRTLKDIQRSTNHLEKVASSTYLSSVRQWCFWGTLAVPSFVSRHSEIPEIGSFDEAYRHFLRVFTDTLAKCPNVRSLQFTCVPIDQPLQRTMLGLGRLEELVLASCDLSEWTAAFLPVQKLVFVEENVYLGMPGAEGNPLHIVCAESLHALSLKGLDVSLSLLSGFATVDSKPFSNLTTLSVQLWDSFLPPFLSSLAHCPQLKELKITDSAISTPPTIPLPPTTIPLLRSFKGPRFLAVFFVSQRPVCEMELIDGGGHRPKDPEAEKDVLDDLADIARACPALRALLITSPIVNCLRTAVGIAKHWPELRVLSFVLRSSSGVRRPSLAGPLDFSDSDDEESVSELDDEGDASDSEDSHSNYGSDQIVADSPGEAEEEWSDPRLTPDVPPVPMPDVLLPGYLYTHDGAFPPREATAAPVPPLADQTSFPTLVDAICAASVFVFAHLERLHFTRPRREANPDALTISDQHRGVLALEHQLPCLLEVEFGIEYLNSVTWRREKGGRTWSQKETRAIIASLAGSEG